MAVSRRRKEEGGGGVDQARLNVADGAAAGWQCLCDDQR